MILHSSERESKQICSISGREKCAEKELIGKVGQKDRPASFRVQLGRVD